MKVSITLDDSDIKPLMLWYEHAQGARMAYQHVDERIAAQVAVVVKDKLEHDAKSDDGCDCGGDSTGCVCDGVCHVCVPVGADKVGTRQ